MTVSVKSVHDRTVWDDAVNALGGHPLQLWGWGRTKAAHRWQVERLQWEQDGEVIACAQVLIRRLPFPFRSLAYIPRGPAAAAEQVPEFLTAVGAYVAERHGSVALRIEPDWEADSAYPAALRAAGFAPSANTILIPRTLVLDLRQDDDALMAAMSKTTRSNVRKALKQDVEYRRVSTAAEFEQVLEIYHSTAERAGFGVYEDDYYRDLFANLGDSSPIIVAARGDEVLAFVWLARSATTAFELYSGVAEAGQKLRVNYGVKWSAFQQMRQDGCTRYDFNGLLNDGVSDFKKQFARHEDQLIGTWDRPLSAAYPVFATALPLARTAIQAARKLLRAAGGIGRSVHGRLLARRG